MLRPEVVSFLGAVLAWGVLTRAPSLFLFALVLLLAVSVSGLWEKYCLSGIEFRRHLSEKRVGFGERIALEIEIVNRKLLPVPWLEFEDEIPASLPPERGRVLPALSPGRSILAGLVSFRPYERVRRQYHIDCTARGEHCFGPAGVRSGELFGFVTREKALPNEDTLIVYPRVLPLTELGLPARSPLGDLRAHSWIFEDVSRSAGAREHRPGDGLRRIHWPASARTQSLQTRVFEATTSHKIGIFLNVSLDDEEGSESPGRSDVLELCVTAAASIASWALERRYQTGIYTNGRFRHGTGAVAVEPAGDTSQLEKLLLALARLQLAAAQPFEELLSERFRDLPFGTTVVVVTAALSPGVSAQLLDLRARGHLVTLVAVGDGTDAGQLPGVTVHRVAPQSADEATASLFVGGHGVGR